MEPGSIVDDRFEVLEHHADGGMGVVYRGLDRLTEGEVAIKIVRVPTHVELGRFEREVDLLATLSHPGIVRYIAHGSADAEHRYLIQEWIQGQTLHQRQVSVGLTRCESLDFVKQVAHALIEAHDLGIVHRDIKPNNLIIESGEPGRVRVLDFGLARLTEASDRVTRTGTAVGTPGYMAPEQILGTKAISPAVDVFALGCVLYRALSGHHPFAGRDPAAVRTKVLMCEPLRLDRLDSEVAPDIAALVEEMLRKQPLDRPRDANAVVARIDALEHTDNEGRTYAAAPNAAPTLALPTAVLEGAHVSVVMLRDLSRDEVVAGPSELDQMRGSLQAALGVFRGDLEVLDVSTAVFRLAGERVACAVRAVRAAFVLAALYPSAGIAVASGEVSDLGAAIEDASRCAESAGLRQLFDSIAGVVYTDAATASLLPSLFTVEEGDGVCLVRMAPGGDRDKA